MGNPQDLVAHFRWVDAEDVLTFFGHTAARALCLAMIWPAVTRQMPYDRWGSGAPVVAAIVACEAASTPLDAVLLVILAPLTADLSSP